jgi:hypothetical protein
MNSSANGLPKHLPHRFPVGATYVVEGYGGEDGDLRVISRYVVLPGGRRINVPGAVCSPVQPLPPLFAVRLTDCNIRRKIDQRGERKNSRVPPERDEDGRVD